MGLSEQLFELNYVAFRVFASVGYDQAVEAEDVLLLRRFDVELEFVTSECEDKV